MEKKKPENPVIFEILISWKNVQGAYQKRLTSLAAGIEIKGFRKGKAPAKLVEEKVGKSKLYSEIIQDVLPPAYQEEVKKKNLVPMIAPRVKPINIKENEDWRFEITVVTRPEVELRNYIEEIKNKKYKVQDIKADKKTEDTKTQKIDAKTLKQSWNPEIERNRKMGVAFDILLKIVKVELPQILVDEEVNLRLAQLIDQVRSVGMTIEQYLQAKKLTNQQIRMEYEKTARDMLKLNLALGAVASEQKLEGKDRISKAVEFLLAL